jgi:hypothetical protein
MYRFSRSIYRDLAPYVTADANNGHPNGHAHASLNGNGHANGGALHVNGVVKRQAAARGSNHQRLLDACEATMRRLAYDRRYFAHPARSLFGEVRMLFPIQEQDRVFRVIDRNIRLALEHLARLPGDGIGLNGQPSECRAHTRKGTPCQRQPLPGRDYCPSHKHLEESLEPVDETDEVEDLGERAAVPAGAGSRAA